MRVLLGLLVLLACACANANGLVVERVRFPSLDVGDGGTVQMLDAQLFRPSVEDGTRLPAVVALHGCGGMYSTVKARRNELSIRHRTMAELLAAEGYAVLFPDSFRSRGQEEICTQRDDVRTITQRQRRLDALGALAHLQTRPEVAADRIAVLGWSHGGSTVLAAMNAHAGALPAPFFRAAVAFYPGCIASLRAKEGYAPAAPLLLLVGASDDWTSPRPCIALVERLKHASAPADIVVYPDTFHGFDGPSAQPRMRLDVPNGVHPGEGVTVAVNPAAREDAYRRVKAFLGEALRLRGPARRKPRRRAP